MYLKQLPKRRKVNRRNGYCYAALSESSVLGGENPKIVAGRFDLNKKMARLGAISTLHLFVHHRLLHHRVVVMMMMMMVVMMFHRHGHWLCIFCACERNCKRDSSQWGQNVRKSLHLSLLGACSCRQRKILNASFVANATILNRGSVAAIERHALHNKPKGPAVGPAPANVLRCLKGGVYLRK